LLRGLRGPLLLPFFALGLEGGAAFFLGYGTILVGVGRVKPREARSDEFRLGDRAVAIGVGLLHHEAAAAMMAAAATAPTLAAAMLAVGPGFRAGGTLALGEEFVTADAAVLVGVHPVEALGLAGLAIRAVELAVLV